MFLCGDYLGPNTLEDFAVGGDGWLDRMRADAIDVVVATTPENVRFISGYTTGRSLRLNYNVSAFAVQGVQEPSFRGLILPMSQLGLARQVEPDVSHIDAYGDFFIAPRPPGEDRSSHDLEPVEPRRCYSSAIGALIEAVNEASPRPRKIAVDEMGLSPDIYARLVAAFPNAVIAPAYATLRHARRSKSPAALDALRKAAQIADEAIQSMLGEVREGDLHADLVRRMNARIVDLGALPELTNLRLGPGGAMPDVLPNERQTVVPGSIVTWDIVIGRDGYHADTARSAVFGEATPKQRSIYEAVLAGQQRAVALVRPGAHATEIFHAAVETVRASGIPSYVRNHCGHGIGLEVYELPEITPQSADVIEEGGVFNVETPYYEVGFGCLMIEDTLNVTKDGYEYLTRADRGLRVLG